LKNEIKRRRLRKDGEQFDHKKSAILIKRTAKRGTGLLGNDRGGQGKEEKRSMGVK